MNNLSALTLSAAAALSPSQPVTHDEIAGHFNSEARVAQLESSPPPAPAPSPLDPAQDPKPQPQQAQPGSAPAAAPEAAKAVAEDPAQQQKVELKPEEKLQYSVALAQVKLLNEEAYKKIAAGASPDQVLKEAQEKLAVRSRANELSLTTLEQALGTPEEFALMQRGARESIEAAIERGLADRMKYAKLREGEVHRRPKASTEEKEQTCAEIERVLMLKREDGQTLDVMPTPYDRNGKIGALLRVTPMSKVVEGLSPEEQAKLVILASPTDPTKPLDPKELRKLTDKEIEARYQSDRPVEGDTTIAGLKESRQKAMDKLTDDQKAALKALEAKAAEVAQQEIVMQTRGGIPGGVRFHEANDRSSAALGRWQHISTAAENAALDIDAACSELNKGVTQAMKGKTLSDCRARLIEVPAKMEEKLAERERRRVGP